MIFDVTIAIVLGHHEPHSHKTANLGSPGGAVVKNLPARFEPWSRKIPHAAEQLSPCTTATEPVL